MADVGGWMGDAIRLREIQESSASGLLVHFDQLLEEVKPRKGKEEKDRKRKRSPGSGFSRTRPEQTEVRDEKHNNTYTPLSLSPSLCKQDPRVKGGRGWMMQGDNALSLLSQTFDFDSDSLFWSLLFTFQVGSRCRRGSSVLRSLSQSSQKRTCPLR